MCDSRAIFLAAALLADPPTPQLSVMWLFGGALLIVVSLGATYLFSVILRRSLSGGKTTSNQSLSSPKPSTDNPAAFMAASMQAVIQKLRDQEKELAALHQRDRERAEQTERLSETVTRNMPAGLLLVSSSGIVTSANPAAEVALGIRALAFRRYTEVFSAPSPLAQLLTECLQQGRTFRREEVEYTTPGGELRRLGVTISPILENTSSVSGIANTGKITGALCLLSDLTELAALQRQILMKDSLAALGELSAGIAHEFKNALATISGYAQMIRSETTGDVADNAHRILDQTRSLAHVVTEFLKFARPMDLVNEEISVQPLIDRVVAEMCEVKPNVEITSAGNFDKISGDEDLLRQALLNLARNAAESAGAQPAPGRVTLQGAVEHVGGHQVQRISVCDNGSGVPPADLSRIFAPFYTTKTDGTGLGLAIVQKIVLQHGGSVEARNRPQGGAEFIIWLPLSRHAASAVDSAVTTI